MTKIGYFLSSEEHDPLSLLDQALGAEAVGMEGVFISDHFHPWNDAQGQSPFVWSVIGAIGARTSLSVMTGVTCPTIRIHPAIVAQAAATCQILCKGRFSLGIGSGENLNEHVLGDRWPEPSVRLDMLEEAIEVIRGLHKGGEFNYHGQHYTVDRARIYSLPERPPEILMSAFGNRSTEIAARAADGYVTTRPDRENIDAYRSAGGRGRTVAAVKVCWAETEQVARARAYRLWANELLPGELPRELATPGLFEQANTLVSEEMIPDAIACGPDPERHLEKIRPYLESGFDELYISQIGPDAEGFFRFFEKELAPRL